MASMDEVKAYCKELSPPDVERAVKFNEVARDESIISYGMFLEQNKLPRQVFIQGYNAMYAAAALFLAKKYKVKVDEHMGSTHKRMREVLDFYTSDSEHHQKLIALYEKAIEKFQILNQQYNSEKHFASKVVSDLMSEGFYQGKKVTYYAEIPPGRKDPLTLDIPDAKKFIRDIVEPFLFIIGELTNA
ncbi:hypothetical protein HY638_04015 [Candidatus Woesearchaeota archaeon]|nr:hypothetical protein [Candidatus Woesearchaeota archaeon]